MNDDVQGQLGQKLHDARVSKGLTLDDLQQSTKIQKRYLIAIEDEKFDELPGDFYVRAFVKQYAEAVGLDGAEVLAEAASQLPNIHTQEYEEKITEAQQTRSGKAQRTNQFDKLRQYLPRIVVVVVVILILGAIWLTAIHSRKSSSSSIDSSSISVSGDSSSKSSSSTKSSSAKTSYKSSSKTSTTSLKIAQSARTSSTATFNVTGKATSGYTLQLSATGAAWTQAVAGGSTLYSGTLESGSKQSLKVSSSASQIVLTLGKASVTSVKLNGKTVDLTASNQYPNVRTVTINLNSTSSSSTGTTSTSSSN